MTIAAFPLDRVTQGHPPSPGVQAFGGGRGFAVGGCWNRTNDVEIDIVGADRAPIANELLFVGSIK